MITTQFLKTSGSHVLACENNWPVIGGCTCHGSACPELPAKISYFRWRCRVWGGQLSSQTCRAIAADQEHAVEAVRPQESPPTFSATPLAMNATVVIRYRNFLFRTSQLSISICVVMTLTKRTSPANKLTRDRSIEPARGWLYNMA
jgi:hypothetical protein